MECYSCGDISLMRFTVLNRVHNPDRSLNECLSMCCENDAPLDTLTNNPEENLKRFIGMRHLAIIRGMQDDAKEQDFPCARCLKYVKGDWQFSQYILYVSLGMYPSPCQCHCSYCSVQDRFLKDSDWKKDPDVTMMYENVFKTLKLAKELKLTLPQKTIWQVASGEITIHPYRKPIMDLVHGEQSIFLTNAFIFDEDIARELRNNPLATINLSIDCGTAETWRKVKGVDNFNHVLDNLKAYRKASQRPGQITLKYIVLPDVNDSDEDFFSFANIVKSLDAQVSTISRDDNASKVFGPSRNENWHFTKTIESAARLLAICNFNGIYPRHIHGYSAYEQNRFILLASKILELMR